jgi:hypothetical protein
MADNYDETERFEQCQIMMDDVHIYIVYYNNLYIIYIIIA